MDCVRGSEDDPLARYVQVNRRFGLDIVVRLTADNPLLDPSIVNEMVRYFLASHPPLDYLSNARRCGYPFGYIAEVIRAECLEAAFAAESGEHLEASIRDLAWLQYSGATEAGGESESESAAEKAVDALLASYWPPI